MNYPTNLLAINKFFVFSFFILFIHTFELNAQQRPKVGLTLSGGGAKGLAHIGVLSAIDSAGLHIDYVTGTSMGSVMGGLYALGYSGDSICSIAKSVDWNMLLSNKPLLKSVSIEEKKELGWYAVELPIKRWKPVPFTGLIDGQELWITLKKYFLPAYNITDFSKLPKSFLCIGTNIETGDPVVLKNGNLTDAVRASMAIPSVFTSVNYNGETLVDGGLLRNFPVSDVKGLGADIIVGVNVGSPLAKIEELNTPVSVLYQITGFADAHDYEIQKQLCDIIVEPDISAFSAASFGSSDSIINVGYAEGKKMYPAFKALADSLNKLYPEYNQTSNSILDIDSVFIVKVSFKGMDKTESNTLKDIFDFKVNQYYTAEAINEKVRMVYGTRNYTKIKYDISEVENGKSELIFDVEKNSGVALKAGLHYNSYSKAAIIASFTSKNNFISRSKFFTKFNFSENPRALVEFKKYFASLDKFSVNLTYEYTGYDIQLALNGQAFADYRSQHQTAGINLSRYFKSSIVTIGYEKLYDKLRPIIGNFIYAKGNSEASGVFLSYYHNNLDRTVYPTKGWNATIKGSYFFDQKPDITYYLFDAPTEGGGSPEDYKDFPSVFIKSHKYFAISNKSTISTSQHLGVNFENASTLNGAFYYGGITDFEYNQVPFAGLSHTTIITESAAAFGIGWQYNITGKIFSTLRSNFGLYDFNGINSIYEITAKNNFVSGYAASIGLVTIIGPIEFSVMYNDYNNNVSGYLNLGLHF